MVNQVSIASYYWDWFSYEMSNMHRHAIQTWTDQCLGHWRVSKCSTLWSF